MKKKSTLAALLCCTAMLFAGCKDDLPEPEDPETPSENTNGGKSDNGDGEENGDNGNEDVVPSDLLPGTFSVSESRQVQFSKGNLQYIQSSDTWRFADFQYSAIGTANMDGSVLADTIDLYGWSANNNTARWGVSLSEEKTDYSQGSFLDWGRNMTGGWRTLSLAEWLYLVKERNDADAKRGLARIFLNEEGSLYVNGLVLLPDNWSCPEDVEFNVNACTEKYMFAENQLSEAQWRKMEQAGAVFLPVTGWRSDSKTVSVPDIACQYWTSSVNTDKEASMYYFYAPSSILKFYGTATAHWGEAVRLVKDKYTGGESGASKAFSVADGTKALFAPGNLQYNNNTDKWRFAANQYDCLGIGNETAFDSYGWRDLYGWGTGNNPTKSSDANSAYAIFYDWGENAIGDDEANTWRTPTAAEWNYLLKERPNAGSLYGLATVAGVKGVVIFPDSWSQPSGTSFNSGAAGYDGNEYDSEVWTQLDAAGAVFLPASGYYDPSPNYAEDGVQAVQRTGGYWSSDPAALYFNSNSMNPQNDKQSYKYTKYAVRLIKNL